MQQKMVKGIRFEEMPAAQQAAILCNDPRFQTFAARRTGYPDDAMEPSAAAEYIRQVCGVESRRSLNTDPAARTWQQLRTEFDAWSGKLATPNHLR